MSTTNTQKILFIDSAVGDISNILTSVDPLFEVVLLSGDRNGLEQMAQALDGRSDVDAVHVISHGGSGYLQLGDGLLDLLGLDSQSDALATVRDALSEDADLLLYGCDVAAGDAGAAFINALAAATGADVAASLDLTGPALLGGDGTLEASTGTIEADVLDLIGIEALLGAPANDGFENNFTGWTSSDAVIGTGGVYVTDGPDWTVNPYGTKMAVVQPTGSAGEKSSTYDVLGLGSAARTYLDGRFPNPTNFGHVYTTVTLAAGEEFSMAWNYVATDYSPFNDASVVTFVNTTNTSDLSMQIKPGADSSFSGGQVGILGATVAGTGNYVTGNYGSTGWQVVTLKAGQAGTYKLGFAVFNLDDTVLSPYLFVDQAQGTTLKDGTPFNPVPAPAVQPPPPVTNAAPTFSATTHTNGSTLTDTAADDSFATLAGKVNASDSNNDTLTFAVSGATSGTTVKTGVYGTFTITNATTGAFTYTPNDAAIEGRKTGITESFTVTVSDGKGGNASTTVTFTIAGANDTTAFSGTNSAAVGEDGTASASGTVSATDRDTGDATIVASAATSVYGTFIVNAAGQWSYTLNNGNAAVQGLTQGQTVNDTFYVSTAGGASQAVTIAITGQNDRPTLSSNAALLAQVEDSTDTTATSIATLLGGRFADVDSGASFAGVLVAGNASTGAQGVWQYQFNGSSTWVDIPAAGLTSTHALALSASTLVRFVPATDYNGTPGALSVYAADNVYAGGFSTGTEVFADVTVGGVSVASRAVSITITPANDAPVFSGANASIGLTEGAGADSTASLQAQAAGADPVVALTGTVAATDVDNATHTLTYSILGGQSGVDAESGLTVVQGTYGRLTLDPVSGDWTYSPTNTAAINALEAGEVGVETFTFKVTDGAGASDTQTLSVSITGSDDAPVLASALSDTTVTGGQWTYQLPVGSFTDAEGEALVYSAGLVDANGDLVGDGSLPAGLSFDGATRTFTGASPLAYNGQQFHLKVTASDGSAAVSDVFRLTVANQAPTSADHSLSFAEDQVRVLTLADFGPYADADGDALSSVTITALPAQGALQFNDGNGWVAVTQDQSVSATDIAAGHLRFAPGADDSGNVYATLQFQVSDGTDLSGTHTLTLNVSPVADAPALTGTPHSFAAAAEDTPFTVTKAQLLQGFTDADPGQKATLAIDALSVSNAQVVDNGDGTWTVTPYANLFNSALTLSYTVVDSDGLTATRTLGLWVGGANDTPPTRTGDAAVLAAGTEDQSYTVTLAQLKQGFSDVDGNMGVWGLTADHGSVSTSDGGLTYTITPNANYNGPVTLSYNVDDGQSATATSIVFSLNPANDAPVSTSTSLATAVNTTYNLGYSGGSAANVFGFADIDTGDTFQSIKITALPSVGTLTIFDNGYRPVVVGDVISKSALDYGWLTYTSPNSANLNTGYTSLKFQVGDGDTFSTEAYTLSFNGPATAATLAASTLTTSAASTWTNAYSGSPIGGFAAEDTVRVVVETSAGNIRLTTTNGVTTQTGYGDLSNGTATSIAFEGTLADVNAALASLQVNRGSADQANVTVSAVLGGAAYNPSNGHYYEVVTAGVGTSWAVAKAAAEAMSFNGLSGYLATITSSAENAFILSKLTQTGWIGASDQDTEGTWKWETGPEGANGGTVFSIGNINPVTQNGMYANWNPSEPNDSGSNEDYAQFFASGTGQWNDLPGTADNNVAAYIVEYGGYANQLPDKQVSRTFTVSAAVIAANVAPTDTASTTFAAVNEDTAVTISADDLLAGFSDADNDALTVAGLSADHASVVNNGNGTWTIKPYANYNGTITLSYSVIDGQGGSVAASNTYEVNPVNDAPALTSAPTDLGAATQDTPKTIAATALLGGYTDPDGTTPFIKDNSVTADHGATVSFDSGTGTYTVTPAKGYSGPITLSYTVTDGTVELTITRVLEISPVNDAPVVSAPLADQAASENQPFSFAFAPSAFADPESAALTYSATWVDGDGNPVNGGALPAWLAFDAQTREFSGTPPFAAAGSYAIRVTASDGSLSAQDTFVLTVAETNQAPTVASALQDQTLTQVQNGIDLSQVFSDAEGGALTLTPTLANGDPLPSWLIWNAGTQTLSGNPPGGQAYVDIKVVAEDPASGTAESTFRINLTDAGQTPNTMIGTLVANNAGAVSVAASGGSDPYPLGTVLTATVSDTDGFNSANVVYQWQVSADGSTWSDIAGATAASFTLAQAQSDQQVRVQAFYNDNGSVLEMPVSTAVGVALTDQAGAVTVSGSPAAGQTLQATLTDPDGLLGATPVYTWQTSVNGSTGWTQVATGASNAYTLTNNDGGRYVRVVVTYVDDADTPERTVTGALSSGGSPVVVQLGAVSPVPADQTANAVEAGGVADATAGNDPNGNLLTGATDANAGDVISFDSVRTGSALGLGTPALPDPESAGDVVVQGIYGQLRVNTATGDYSYTVDNASAGVQALYAGQQVSDSFNYSLKDATDLTGSALLTFTVTGADDAPAGTGLPTSASVMEDVTTAVDLSGLALSDFDGALGEVYAISVSAGTVGATLAASSAGGVVVTGSGSGTITLTGTLPNLNAFIDNAAALTYTSKVNDDTDGTLTVQLRYGVGLGNAIDLGSVAVGITPVNDAPTLDLDANNSSGATGTGYTTSFQPRSQAPVAVVDSDLVIGDVDVAGGLSDTLTMATVALSAGALDNVAQTQEKLTAVGPAVVTVGDELRFTFDNYDPADGSTYLVVAGNGTGKVTFLGKGTHTQYEAAIKSVVYENTSGFASAGTRTVTITVTDGADTGGQPLSVSANTTLLQPWTPVADLNGDSDDVFDRDHAVTFTEEGASVAIAASDASLTDLDSNIQKVVVSLRTGDADAPVGAEDELLISPALVTLLAAAPYSITTVVSSDKHSITFTGNSSSSVFQLALRSVQYQNTSESPTAPLVRHVDVTSLDVNNHVGVPATTTITVVPVNDAPLAVLDTASATEAGGVLNATAGVDPAGNLLTNDTDPDTAGANADTQAVQSARVGNTGDFTAVADGSSSAAGGTVLVGQYGTLTIGADGSYVYEVDNGNAAVQALDDGSPAPTDVFSYTLVDSGNATSTTTLTVSIAGANDTPVITVDAASGNSDAEGVTEADAALTTSGTLSVEDVDTVDSVTVSVSAVAASGATTGLQSDNAALLAMMSVDAGAVIDATQTTGTIHWAFGSGAEAFDHLADGETLTLTYTLTVDDGTTTNTHDVVVTVTGTNDVPVIGGVNASDVTEDTAVASDQIGTQGQLTIADADHGQSNFAAQASYTGTYGSFTLAADGTWTYSADNTQAAIQQLGTGESLTDSFTAISSDGTASQLVTVTINGSNDVPTIGGVHTSSVTEDADVTDGLLSTQGQLTIDDTDQGQANFTVQASHSGTYGTFTLAADGSWTYSADNTQAAIQQLAAGESLTDSFTAESSDGSASQIVTVTIQGTNDTPVITVGGGDSVSAGITETNAVISASGTLTVTDVDASDTVEASVQAVSVAGSFDGLNPLDSADLLAMLSLTTGAIGADAGDAQNLGWAFNSGSAAAFDFLPAGETLELTYTVQVADSADPALTTSQDVTITITGTDDKPVIDISGADVAGIDGEVVFKPRGDGVALFGTDLAVGDVDDAELLTGATLVLDSATALDNAFGTTYETLYAVSTADATVSGGTITVGAAVLTVSGNGTAASPLVITGAATAADYKAALQTLHYANTNPNAFAGDRTISVTVRDDGVAPANADKLLSDAAELTVSVNWTPVIDLNGALTGRNYSTAYVEKQPTTTYVAAPTATLFDQNGLIQSLTITLQNAPDGTSEVLSLSAATLAVLQSNGIKAEVIVTDGASHQVVLSAWDFTNDVAYADGRSTSAFQIGLRGVAYSNLSAAPDENTARTVLISALDVDGTAGVSAITTINVTGVNIPPVLADVANDGAVTETDQSSAFTGANLTGTLVATDEDLQDLTYGIATGSGTYAAVPALETAVTIDAVDYQVGLDGAYGTLYVNSTTGQYAYVPDADLVDTIDAGDTKTETFNVFATDGESDLVVKTYTIELNGADDAPTLASVSASVAEDSLSATTTDEAITGSLAGADVDEGAVLIYGITGGLVDLDGNGQPTGTVSLALAYGTLVVNTSTGAYAYTQDAAAVEALAVTETDTDVFTITISDGTGALVTNTLTVTVSGANDAPVAAVAVNSATEDGALVTGSVSSSDVDMLNTTASYALDAAVAGLTLNANGSYSFNPAHAAYQYLAEGETLDVVAAFTVTDDQGASHGATLTITVTGTNDAPVAAVAVNSATEDGALVTGSVSSSDVDVLNTTASYALDAAVAGLTLNADGSYSFNPAHAAYQYLAEGQTLDVVADFTVTDDQGATSSSTLTITVTGTNDAPVAAVAVNSATEDGALVTGSVSSSDVDVLGTTASYALNAAVAGLTLNADGSYSFNPAHAAYQYLAEGQTLDVVAAFTVTDDQGASHGATLTITVTGTNDAPVAAVAVNSATEDGALVTGSVSSSDVDVLNTTASYALDAAVAGLTLNADGSYSFNPAHAAYQYLADGQTLDVVAAFTVTDDQGATHGATLTITVTGTNDAPVAVADVGAAREKSGLENAVAGFDATGDVLSNDTDVDNTDTRFAVEVQSLTGSGAASVVPASSTSAVGYVAVAGEYGTLHLGADGSYRYLVNEDDPVVQALRTSGDTLEDVFAYTVADGTGATASSSLTITVQGANDAPTLVRVSNLAITELTGATPNTATAVNVGALTTDDPDNAETFAYDIIGGAQQFYFQIGLVGGVATLQLRQGVPLNAEFLSEYSVVVRSTDALGLSTFETFVLQVGDVNEFGVTAPTFNVQPMLDGLDPNTVPENTAVNTFIGVTASAVDADATNNTVTYALVSNALGAAYTAGEFRIDAVDGKVYVAGPLDREGAGGGSRTLFVKTTSSDGSSAIRSLNLFIADANEHAVSAPVDANVSANAVAENAPVGLNVGITASASDADATTNSVSYSLVNADGSAYTGGEFVIGGSNGIVTVGGPIDREAGATRTLYVKAVSVDGSSAIRSFTLNVGDVNEFSPVFASGATGSVNENAVTSTVIYQASSSDADATAVVSYSLTGADAALLNINASTGAVTLKASADFEAKPSYSFNVVANDGANSTTQAVVVSVANVDEPVSGSLAVVGVAALNQTLAVQSTLNDPDGMGAVSYQWLADGQPIDGAISAELLLGSSQVGKAISVQISYVDGTGALVTVPSVGATDKVNAVDPSQEAEVPGLPDGDGNTVSGDGNGDGIADAQQDAVASIAASLPSSGGGEPTSSYLSLVATDPAAQGEGSSANAGAVITSFQQTEAPDDLPDNVSMPLGAISFTAQAAGNGEPGETLAVPETFSLYVDKDLDINGFWVTGNDGVLYNLASAVNGGQIVEEGGKLRVDFTIPEGSDLYADMVHDGVLTVTGALGHVDDGISGVVPAPTTTAFWF